MADDIFVDLKYRGLELESGLQIEEFSDEQAFLHFALPMPVGTEVTLDVGNQQIIVTRVSHVSEDVAGQGGKVGMVLTPIGLIGNELVWWQDKVTKSEKAMKTTVMPVINPADVSDVSGRTVVMDVIVADDIAAAETNSSQTTLMESVTKEEVEAAKVPTSDSIVMDAVGAEEVLAAQEKPKKKKRRVRKKKR